MTLRELKELINLMKEYNLSELEMEREEIKIRLKREPSGKMVSELTPVSPLQPAMSVGVSPNLPVGQQTTREGVEEANALVIRSPMVGTFYVAPAPDAAPYVTKGKQISPGDILCIIEAMKLMNEIKSDVTGVILEILVENGQPVEFDQPLFKVRKT